MTAELATFWLPASLMGLGIAIDVFLMTVLFAGSRHVTWRNWTLPVTLTHIAFPAVGYYSFWFLGNHFQWLSIALGLIGAVLVAFFVITAFIDWRKARSPVPQLNLLAVLAVSWDALWSGPAKASLANVAAWTDTQVALSFVVAGLVVAIAAQLSLHLAKRLTHWIRPDSLSETLFFFVELSVIGGFGVLSLAIAIDASGFFPHFSPSLASSITLAGLLFALPFWQVFQKKRGVRRVAPNSST